MGSLPVLGWDRTTRGEPQGRCSPTEQKIQEEVKRENTAREQQEKATSAHAGVRLVREQKSESRGSGQAAQCPW